MAFHIPGACVKRRRTGHPRRTDRHVSRAGLRNRSRASMSLHRVTVAQVSIPALLGNKTAVFAMAPESRNGGSAETMSVWISLPPNPQQVWSVQRQFNGSIHTTIGQIIESLRQKIRPGDGVIDVQPQCQPQCPGHVLDLRWKRALGRSSDRQAHSKGLRQLWTAVDFHRQHAKPPCLSGNGWCGIDSFRAGADPDGRLRPHPTFGLSGLDTDPCLRIRRVFGP